MITYTYQTLSNSYDTCFNAFKTIGQDLKVCFNEGETIADYIDTVKNKVKSISKARNFTFKVKANDLKTKKFGIWSEETAQGTADRINAEIRKQITPIIQHIITIDEDNKNLLEKNKDLENKNSLLSKENEELKGFKAVALKLLQEIGYFFKSPTLDQVIASVKDFGSKLFNAFISNNDRDLEVVQRKIISGQEFKLTKQLDKQAKIEKEVDQALGFGQKPKENDKEHSKVTRSRQTG